MPVRYGTIMSVINLADSLVTMNLLVHHRLCQGGVIKLVVSSTTETIEIAMKNYDRIS